MSPAGEQDSAARGPRLWPHSAVCQLCALRQVMEALKPKAFPLENGSNAMANPVKYLERVNDSISVKGLARLLVDCCGEQIAAVVM